jgi:hypothetical protein
MLRLQKKGVLSTFALFILHFSKPSTSLLKFLQRHTGLAARSRHHSVSQEKKGDSEKKSKPNRRKTWQAVHSANNIFFSATRLPLKTMAALAPITPKKLA